MARLRGVRAARVDGVVLRTRSVHTFGMDADVLVMALDDGGRVLSAGMVRPRRVRVFRGAAWIVELPPSIPAPEPGSRLALLRRILIR